MESNQLPTLVFATNNAHKLSELRDITRGRYIILSLSDIGCDEDIDETADTLEGNACIKASYIKEHYGYECFADDTGLMVDALGGAPGVFSARYAGPGHDSAANMEKLLREMEKVTDRKAHFSTVIALTRPDGTVKYFEGRVDGVIATAPRGEEGFGYDPLFVPDEDKEHRTFAQMTADEKHNISHRGRAVRQLLNYLTSDE